MTNDLLRRLQMLLEGDPVYQTATIRDAAVEIERLTAALQYEENRRERIGTHGPGCEKWGPRHYECLVREHERITAKLKVAEEALVNIDIEVTREGSRWPHLARVCHLNIRRAINTIRGE